MKFHRYMITGTTNHLRNKLFSIVCGALLLTSHSALAQQRASKTQQQTIKIEETIRGNANQEQPKVLTIVPWQQPNEKQALPSPISERLNKQFKPLERDEFRRQLRFFENQAKPID
ncbi:MAG: hypothetical protein ACI88A_002633 [Paraglaciecola sp.]|jgi:hypothetical protein